MPGIASIYLRVHVLVRGEGQTLEHMDVQRDYVLIGPSRRKHMTRNFSRFNLSTRLVLLDGCSCASRSWVFCLLCRLVVCCFACSGIVLPTYNCFVICRIVSLIWLGYHFSFVTALNGWLQLHGSVCISITSHCTL